MSYLYFVGIDIAKDTHVISILDRDGERVGKTLTLTNTQTDFNALKAHLNTLPESSPATLWCGLEATGNLWEPLYAFLISCGYQVTLINPHQTKKFKQLDNIKIKTDAVDSLAIAGLLRVGKAKQSFVPQENIRELREAVRLKATLIKHKKNYQRKALTLLQVLFPEYTQVIAYPFGIVSLSILNKYPSATMIGQLKPRQLITLARKVQGNNFSDKKALELIAAARTSVASKQAVATRSLSLTIVLDQIKSLKQSITQLEQRIDELINPEGKDYTGLDGTLSTIPGVGPKTIAAFIAEVGDGSRFSTGKDLIGFLGLFPRQEESGESKNPYPKMVKTGPSHLRHALYLCAVACVKHNPELRSIYHKKVSQGKPKIQALIVLARKISVLMLAMLKSGEVYQPRYVFSSANLIR